MRSSTAHAIRLMLSGGTARTYSPMASVLLLLPLVGLLVGVFFYPIGRLLATSFLDPDLTLVHYYRLFAEPVYATILLRTLRTALFVTLSALVLGYPLAYLMTQLTRRRTVVVAACILIPLWTSVLVRSYAWTILLQRNGIINAFLRRAGVVDDPVQLLYTEGAVLLAMTHVLLPFMILPIYSVLRRIPADITRAAQNLGAGTGATFRYVVLPLSLPGVVAGAVIVFILALGFFVTPALVGGPRTLMIATLISQQATELLDWPFAGALAGVLLALTLAIVLVFNRVFRFHRAIEDAA